MLRKGDRRSYGLVVFLSVITLGVYWYYWIWRAFAEVIEVQQRRPWPGLPVLGIALLRYGGWILLLALYGTNALDPEGGPFSEAAIAGYALQSVVVVLELIYLSMAQNRLLVATAATTGDTVRPHALLYAAMVFLLLSSIPVFGLLLGLLGLLLLVMWVANVQGKINAYWDWRHQPPPAFPRTQLETIVPDADA